MEIGHVDHILQNLALNQEPTDLHLQKTDQKNLIPNV
jgi:hypothetical protein